MFSCVIYLIISSPPSSLFSLPKSFISQMMAFLDSLILFFFLIVCLSVLGEISPTIEYFYNSIFKFLTSFLLLGSFLKQ